MRQTVCLLAALLVVPSLGSDAPREYDGATERDELEGSWELTALVLKNRGREVRLSGEKAVTFRRGCAVYHFSTGEVRFTYIADRNCTPPHLDETFVEGPRAGQLWMNLYQVEGDTLRIGYNPTPTRPRDFGDSVYVATYRRMK